MLVMAGSAWDASHGFICHLIDEIEIHDWTGGWTAMCHMPGIVPVVYSASNIEAAFYHQS